MAAKKDALTRQKMKDLNEYEKQCVAEVDIHNRTHDTDYSVSEAKMRGGILTHISFEDFLDSKYPERAVQRRKRAAQAEARARYLQLPLSERIRYQATAELAGALRVHAQNLQEIEDALEAELEEDNGMGMFG